MNVSGIVLLSWPCTLALCSQNLLGQHITGPLDRRHQVVLSVERFRLHRTTSFIRITMTVVWRTGSAREADRPTRCLCVERDASSICYGGRKPSKNSRLVTPESRRRAGGCRACLTVPSCHVFVNGGCYTCDVILSVGGSPSKGRRRTEPTAACTNRYPR